MNESVYLDAEDFPDSEVEAPLLPVNSTATLGTPLFKQLIHNIHDLDKFTN